MKIQHYAIIFIIIILPFSIICKSKINNKIDTLNDETRINNAIDTATTDAIDTLIELNGEYYNLSEGQTLDVTPTLAKEAIDIFFKTLSVNYTLPFIEGNDKFNENYFSPYVPAIIVVAYDGFYVYSIEDTATGTQEYVLSPKIPYAYADSGYVINFTLGNYIKLYAPNGILYEGEFREDFIDESSGDYKEFHDILSVKTLENLPQLTTDMSLIVYGLKEDGFSLPDFLSTQSTDPNAVSMLRDYSTVYTDDNGNTATQDDDVSSFNRIRRKVIIGLITDVLNEKMNQHSRYADMMGVNYDFYLPTIDNAVWINAVDDISIMSFIQGIPIGTESYYNNYALGASRIIQTEYIYGTGVGAAARYHRKSCIHLAHDMNGDVDLSGSVTAPALPVQEIFINKIDAAKKGYYPCLDCRP